MSDKETQVMVELPEGVTASFADGVLVAKGPKGEVSMRLASPRITVSIDGGQIILGKASEKPTKRDKMFLHTYRAHVRNIVKGVAEGFIYKLKICSGHFPMNVSVKGNLFEVKNYLGESVPRRLKLKEGAKVEVSGDIITVESASKEIAGTVAGDIEQLMRITNRDRRIFQDGIFIIDKAGKEL